MTPSTTIGSDTTPMAVLISKNHASPSPLTFWSVICFSGLKWPSSKVLPFSSQLFPAAASEVTRASLTSPGLGTVSAGALHPLLGPSAIHTTAIPQTPHGFMPSHLSISQQCSGRDSPPNHAEQNCVPMLEARPHESQRAARMDAIRFRRRFGGYRKLMNQPAQTGRAALSAMNWWT